MDRETEIRSELDKIAVEMEAEWQRRTKPLTDELNEILRKKPMPSVVIATGDVLGTLAALLGGDVRCNDPACPNCNPPTGKPN